MTLIDLFAALPFLFAALPFLLIAVAIGLRIAARLGKPKPAPMNRRLYAVTGFDGGSSSSGGGDF